MVVAATLLCENGDYLLTKNKKHFLRIPALKGKVFTPKEFFENIIFTN